MFNKKMIKKSAHICLMMAGVFILISSSVLWAQDAKFRGTIKDEEGNPVPAAKITLTLMTRNLDISFESNKKGNFFRRGIDPGEYMLTVEVEGYQPLKQQILINAGQEYMMDIVIAKESSGTEAKTQFEQGVQFYQQGRLDEAVEAFEALLKEKPDFAEGHYNLGMVYLRKGETETAIAKMEKAIELKPEFVEAYFGIGQAYIDKGEEEEAIKIYNRAVNINPNNAKIYVNLGAVYFNNKKDDLAMEALLKAKDLDPSLPNIYYQLGLLHIRKQEIEESIKNLEKFLELAPQAPEAESVKAMLEELRKKREFIS